VSEPDPRNAERSVAERLVYIAGGIFVLGTALPVLLVAIVLMWSGVREGAQTRTLTGLLTGAVAIWLLPVGGRLVLGRERPEGGLLPPAALTALGLFFVVAPIALCIAHSSRPASESRWQDAATLVVGLALLRLGHLRRVAARRSAPPTEPGAPDG
jgi:hypothetical protein